MTTDTKIIKDVSCSDDFDPESLLVDDAINTILSTIKEISDETEIEIKESLGRILNKPVTAKINVPGHTNSAMDGYAIKSHDIPSSGVATLKVTGTSWAGKPLNKKILSGECARIMTGAALPEGADTVVMQEHAKIENSSITIDEKNQAKQNVRYAGEDIKKGDIVLKKGKKISAADMGLLASIGIKRVYTKRKIKVTFFSTGDELASLNDSLQEGQIYNSNRYTLCGMLENSNVEITDLGNIPDNKNKIKSALVEASKNSDVVITSGGVSVGDADYVKDIVNEIGKVDFWKVAMKPGRPLAFGKINNACFFGLPGNPVSVMVTFYMFVQPAFFKMMGQDESTVLKLQVQCLDHLRKRPGRVEFQRGVMSLNDQNLYEVSKTGPQGSGILTSMSEANCFIVLPLDAESVKPGDIVTVIPFVSLV